MERMAEIMALRATRMKHQDMNEVGDLVFVHLMGVMAR